jgi:hypothetical protein
MKAHAKKTLNNSRIPPYRVIPLISGDPDNCGNDGRRSGFPLIKGMTE